MRRRLAVGLIVLGSLLVAYAATVLLWRGLVVLSSGSGRTAPVHRSPQAGGAAEGVVGEA